MENIKKNIPEIEIKFYFTSLLAKEIFKFQRNFFKSELIFYRDVLTKEGIQKQVQRR